MKKSENNNFSSFDNLGLPPSDFIRLMFERTDEDGILYIPGWHYDNPGADYGIDGSTDENESYRCKVDWNLAKYEDLLQSFEAHTCIINFLAQKHPNLLDASNDEEAKALIHEREFFEFWKKYLCPLGQNADTDSFLDIEDRLDIKACIKMMAADLAQGKPLSKQDKEMFTEYLDVTVTEQEEKQYEEYIRTLYSEAENRVGAGLCAYDVVIRSRRLFRLISLKAPTVIVYNESKQLAAAMLLHRHGISRENVGNSVRHLIERRENMTDEELDIMYSSKKTNSRKSMAPLFVYTILKQKSNSRVHLRHKDILHELAKYPYEVFLERKALSRIIHNLEDSQYAVFQDKTGVWIDQE